MLIINTIIEFTLVMFQTKSLYLFVVFKYSQDYNQNKFNLLWEDSFASSFSESKLILILFNFVVKDSLRFTGTGDPSPWNEILLSRWISVESNTKFCIVSVSLKRPLAHIWLLQNNTELLLTQLSYINYLKLSSK